MILERFPMSLERVLEPLPLNTPPFYPVMTSYVAVSAPINT